MQHPANNFIHITCKSKWGIDPEVKNTPQITCDTSDEFFKRNEFTYDLIFIDGLHHSDQVQRDFENSLRYLTDNGFIVIHDCLPENEQGTKVPRATRVWWGDVYKFCMNIGCYHGIKYVTYNIDNGCMVVRKDDTAIGQVVEYGTTYSDYIKLRRIAMNVKAAPTCYENL